MVWLDDRNINDRLESLEVPNQVDPVSKRAKKTNVEVVAPSLWGKLAAWAHNPVPRVFW
jgi:hypothetical protein